GDTVAVLGSGLAVVYPKVHASLFRQIGERGLLISEFLPGDPALPHHFPKRNRIIAALVRAIVVVEAGERSGALITVDHGLDLGREILAVPGSVENPRARGTNALLRDGARVLPHAEAVLDELVGLVGEARSGRGPGPRPREAATAVPEELRPLWDALLQSPLGVDQLARDSGLPASRALAGLAALELGGWVLQCPGMRFQRR
ncbi:DNA-processing protein DprA, partial [Gemmatimonadota bacterium]